MEHFYMPTPWGALFIEGNDQGVTSVQFVDKRASYPAPLSPVLLLARQEIEEYLQGRRKTFSFPIHIRAQGFAMDVLNTLRNVPYGSVVTYGELALLAGKPRAARAVGNVMNKNPLCLVLGCHRVIASGGRLGGFGYNIHIKKDLLKLEGYTRPLRE